MEIRLLKSEKEISAFVPLEATEGMQKSYNPIDFGWFSSKNFLISFVIDKKFFFKRLTFTSNIISLSSDGQEEKREFIEAAIVVIKKMGVDFIVQSPAYVIFDFAPHGAIFCPFGTLQIDLKLSQDVLWSNVHSKHRNVIKKAMNENLVVDKGDHYLEDCARIIEGTMARQHKDSISLLQLLNKKEKLGEQLCFYVVKKENVIQGCAVIAWKKGDKALYLYGGSIPSPSAGALNFLQWSILLDMKKEGVLLYDLVGARINPAKGSKYEGIQRFKERMGAALIQGYLWKLPINRFMYLVYNSLILIRNFKYEQKLVRDVVDEEAKRLKENITDI